MSVAARWLPVLGVTLAASAFAWWNRGERVVVDLGVATFYRAPFTLVVFLAFLAGMLSMLLLSLRHDLRVRRELEARGVLGPPAPDAAPVAETEPAQTLLFDPPTPPAGPPGPDLSDAQPTTSVPDGEAPTDDDRGAA